MVDLRLAVVSPFVDRRHGTERALAELLDRLAHRYHCDVHVYAERVEDLALDDPKVPRSEKGAIFWHRVPFIAGPHLMRFLVWMMWNGVVRWRDRVFRGSAFDLVFSPGINCLNPDVVIVHALFHRLRELSGLESPAAHPQPGFFRRFHRRVYYGLLTAIEQHVYSDPRVSLAAVSQRTANLLGQYFQRSDVHVIPNGVDTGQFSASARLAGRREARTRRGFRDSDFVLLLIGNDWSVKGVPAILAAMAATSHLPLRLLVAGNDAVRPFQEAAERFGILSRCHWETPRADVIDLYSAADVYVSPSHEDSFGLPVAEAMACGLPVITTVFAGVSALIGNDVDGFVLRDPEDTSLLARLIERLHDDEALRNRIGQAASKAAQNWTWDRNAAAVWELLKEATARRHAVKALHAEP